VAAEPPPGAAPLSDFADTKCLAFSADGGRLAVGSEDGRLRLLSWPALRVLGDEARAHPDAVSDADFSPDGALLLTTGNEPWGAAGGACVWRVAGQALQRERWLGSFGAPPRARVTLRGARFARDGSGRAFTGVNVAGEARVVAWRVADWAPLALKRALSEPLTSLALSPIDGRLIAAGGAEGSVVMLGARTLAPLRRVKNAHMVFVTAVAFSPAGATLASLSGDASARCTAAPPRKSFIAAVVRLLLLLAVQAIFFCLVLLARKRGVF
jgi:prolactin regulatory element-binding protein